jgi:hypothetical protein
LKPLLVLVDPHEDLLEVPLLEEEIYENQEEYWQKMELMLKMLGKVLKK